MKKYDKYKRKDYTIEDLKLILEEIKQLNPIIKSKKNGYTFLKVNDKEKLNTIINIKYPNCFKSLCEIKKLLNGTYTLTDEFCITCGKRVSYCHGETLRKHCSLKCGNNDTDSVNKIKSTKKIHFGDENYNNFEKIKATKLKRYGNENYNNNALSMLTRYKNGTLFTSKLEIEIKNYLTSLKIESEKYISGNTRIGEMLEIDLYIPELHAGIECNGNYYHSTEVRRQGKYKLSPFYHYNKTMCAFDRGINLIHIWEDQWKNNNEEIKKFLKNRFLPLDMKQLKYINSYIYEEESIHVKIFIKEKEIHHSIFNKINDYFDWNIIENDFNEQFILLYVYNLIINKYKNIKIKYKSPLDINNIFIFEDTDLKVENIINPTSFFTCFEKNLIRYNTFEEAKQNKHKHIYENYNSGYILLSNF